MRTTMAEKYDLHTDKNKWYSILPNNIAHYIDAENVFTMRVESRLFVFDSRFLAIAKQIADVFNYAFEPEVEKQTPPEMLSRPIGHDFGMRDYVN